MINTQVRETVPFKVTLSELTLQDEYIDLDDITEITDDSVFKLTEMPIKVYEFDTQTQLQLSFVRNLDQVAISRFGYTVLDLFSDIGGLLSLLYGAVQIILVTVTFDTVDNYMVSKLYKIRAKN